MSKFLISETFPNGFVSYRNKNLDITFNLNEELDGNFFTSYMYAQEIMENLRKRQEYIKNHIEESFIIPKFGIVRV